MREIIFRGKAGAKMVYGDLRHLNDGRVTIQKDGEIYPYEVVPETVGQYTGLTDKNGKKIFEGDICKFKRFERTCIGKIVYNQKTAGFEFWWDITVGAYGEKATYTANLSVFDEIEIISNEHNNPELSKGV